MIQLGVHEPHQLSWTADRLDTNEALTVLLFKTSMSLGPGE
jgi:hypothetical protein